MTNEEKIKECISQLYTISYSLMNESDKWIDVQRVANRLSSILENMENENSNGELSYQRTSEGLEEWYDSEGNTIHTKDKNSEVWNEYNSDGDMIYERNSNGDEEWYDDFGNLIRYRNSDGFEEWYDEYGNTIITSKV